VRVNSAVMNTLLCVFAAMFIVIILGARGFFPGVVPLMINSADPPVIEDYIYDYFSMLLFDLIPNLLRNLMLYLVGVQTLSLYSSFAVGSIVSGSVIDLTIFEKIATFMIMFASPMLGSIYVQLLVVIIIISFYPFLLSAGFVMRFFDITRKAGSFMVALALSCYIIFLSMYALNAYIITDMVSTSTVYDEVMEIPGTSFASIFSPTGIGVVGKAGQLFYLFANFVSFGLLNKIYNLFCKFILTFAMVAFQGTIVPTFSIIVTTTSINSLSKWFDGFA